MDAPKTATLSGLLPNVLPIESGGGLAHGKPVAVSCRAENGFLHRRSHRKDPCVQEQGAGEAIDHGWPDVVEMREQYCLRRNFIVKAFNEIGLPCHLPRGSFYAFPCIKSTGLTSKEFAVKLLEQERVACVPGSAFGASGEGYVRACFATAIDQVQVAAERIGRFVKRARG